METRIFVSDLKPAKMTAKNISGYVWLDITQGDCTIEICVPARMEACVAMIADAFNSHMNAGPIGRVAQGDASATMDLPTPMFPSGGARTAMAILAAATRESHITGNHELPWPTSRLAPNTADAQRRPVPLKFPPPLGGFGDPEPHVTNLAEPSDSDKERTIDAVAATAVERRDLP